MNKKELFESCEIDTNPFNKLDSMEGCKQRKRNRK
jgi:hypothetical protein